MRLNFDDPPARGILSVEFVEAEYDANYVDAARPQTYCIVWVLEKIKWRRRKSQPAAGLRPAWGAAFDFDEVRDEHLADTKERRDEGIKEADSPFLQDMHYCYDVLVHKILRIPRVDAKVGVGDDDDEEDDDDAALRARCRRLHAEFAAKVEHLRDHQDLLLEAVRARSETESRRLSQGGD